MFHINYLCKTSNNSLSSQVQELKSLIKINSESEYIIEKILFNHVHNEIL